MARNGRRRPPPIRRFPRPRGGAGLTARTVIGGERTKDYILETTGGGAAIVDYDDDGWPDIFLVNGARLSASSTDARAGRATCIATTATAPSPTSPRRRASAARAGDRASAPATTTTTATSISSSPTTAIRCSIATTATAPSAMSRARAGSRCRARAGIRAPRSSTSIATASWTCSSRPTSPTPTRLRYPPGSRSNCFWKGLGVMCGPHGLAGLAQRALPRQRRRHVHRRVREGGPPEGASGIRIHAARPRLRQRSAGPTSTSPTIPRASLLFHNNGDGTFKEVGLQAGVALTADGRAQAGMGVSAGDYDRDGWLDIVKTNFDDDTTSLYRNLGGGTFEDATVPAGLGVNTRYLGWGTGFRRLRSGQLARHLHRQRPCLSGGRSRRRPLQLRAAEAALPQPRERPLRGRRRTRAGPGVLEKKAARGAAFGDLFNTGRQDIVVNNMHEHADAAPQLRAGGRAQPAACSSWARARTAARSARG